MTAEIAGLWTDLTIEGRVVYFGAPLLALGCVAAIIWIFVRGVGAILGIC